MSALPVVYIPTDTPLQQGLVLDTLSGDIYLCSYPAYTVPMVAENDSTELHPITATAWKGSSPSCNNSLCLTIYIVITTLLQPF